MRRVWSSVPSLCLACKHYNGDLTCLAFPLFADDGELGGIPAEFHFEDTLHTQPYPGDHGIQFEPKPGYDAEGREISA